MAFAVRAGDVARPDAPVVTVAVVPPPKNVALAPLPGAVNVTLTPLNGFPCVSFTSATRGAANAVLMAALCGVPLLAAIDPGVPAELVSANEA